MRCTAQKPVLLRIRPDLMKFAAPGLNGGAEGALGDVYLIGTKVKRFIPLDWHPGDEVTLIVPGGGGFGDPEEREKERVIQDVALGLVSAKAARETYGLKDDLDEDGLKIEALREAVFGQQKVSGAST